MKPGLLLLIVHLFEFRWYVANRSQEPLVVEPGDPAQCGESTSLTLLLGPSFRRISVLYRPITDSASALDAPISSYKSKVSFSAQGGLDGRP